VGTGSKYEKREINGISHFLEHMVFKGTKNRPNTLDIAKDLDGIGGIYNAFTGKEYTGFWVKVDKAHLNLAFDVLSDMLFNSLFREKAIEKEKRVISEEINMIKDSPQDYILDLWEELLYGDQPAGWMISGTKNSVSKIFRTDLVNYLKKQFTAENAIIVISGNFKEKEVLAKIKKYFAPFKKRKPQSKKLTKEIQVRPQVLTHFKKTDQSHLCLGVRTFDLFNPKRYVLAVLATLLGGVMSSRLFIEVREKRGLAYYIRTTPQLYTDVGYLVTQAGVDNKRVKTAIGVILKEHKKLREKKVSKEELRKAKESIKGKIYLGLETSDDWASFLASQELLRKKIFLPAEECAMIDKVSAEDIIDLAREIFQPEKLNLSLIGPFKNKKEFERLLTI
jgi:predicted Zn-dependent peptidase